MGAKKKTNLGHLNEPYPQLLHMTAAVTVIITATVVHMTAAVTVVITAAIAIIKAIILWLK